MRLIDADLFMQRIESYNTLDEMDKALYNFALHEIACMPTVDVFEQIRDEIQKEKEAIHFDISEQKAKWTNSGIYDGLTWAQEIIDKYTKGE